VVKDAIFRRDEYFHLQELEDDPEKKRKDHRRRRRQEKEAIL
jgi:hypothetical protein